MSYYAKRFFGQQGIVTDGLKLWLDASNPLSYPGTGTLWSDLSGNGNNGTMVNGVAPLSNAMQFDGVNGRIELPSSVFFIDSALPFTLSAWINLQVFSVPFPTIFSLKTNVDSYGVHISNQGSYLGFIFGSSAGFYKGKTNTPSTFFVGNWVNVVLVYNGLGARTAANFKAYLNGIATTHDNAGAFAAPSNTINRIGLRSDNNQAFRGLVDNTLIYNRALTSEEVNQNFQATRNKYGI